MRSAHAQHARTARQETDANQKEAREPGSRAFSREAAY
jgi:hypothetical protein